ncbi:hypothetical protein Hsero_2491 [Herbaspirillum seropedicae SmR1]|uniref:Uncharacterized protein n=1 Tax=Herbaspirillum seropedicae (strain SmR1) TaxID=757424 RepID=D8IWH0_HERSS|nr:hypothetical protein Hsero_2491 [Herbaspirillum seropedicae SmR1]
MAPDYTVSALRTSVPRASFSSYGPAPARMFRAYVSSAHVPRAADGSAQPVPAPLPGSGSPVRWDGRPARPDGRSCRYRRARNGVGRPARLLHHARADRPCPGAVSPASHRPLVPLVGAPARRPPGWRCGRDRRPSHPAEWQCAGPKNGWNQICPCGYPAQKTGAQWVRRTAGNVSLTVGLPFAVLAGRDRQFHCCASGLAWPALRSILSLCIIDGILIGSLSIRFAAPFDQFIVAMSRQTGRARLPKQAAPGRLHGMHELTDAQRVLSPHGATAPPPPGTCRADGLCECHDLRATPWMSPIGRHRIDL